MRSRPRSWVISTSLLTCSTIAAAQGVPAAAPVPASSLGAGAPDAASAPGDPSPEVQTEYRDVVARAVTEFDAGRWAEARALFVRAHELWPSARTFRTLGMTSFELRAYVQALQELQAALDDPRRPLADDQRAQAATLIDQTRAFVGRYRVRLVPAEAELLVDGAPYALGPEGVLLLEVGRHELIARASGRSELARRLDVRGREEQALTLELAPVPAAVTAVPVVTRQSTAERGSDEQEGGGRLFTWIAGGTAVAVGGASLALWLMSDSEFDESNAQCHAGSAEGCEPGSLDTSKISDLETAHQITAVVAGVFGAAAVVLFFVEGDRGTESVPASLAIGPGGVIARGRF